LARGWLAKADKLGPCSWSTVIDRGVANCLDKIRNLRYTFRLTESLSRSPQDGREDEKPWLFETLAHNPLREPGRASDFLTYTARNSLKRLDSQK
jgi:hypothetical protein